MAVRGILAFGRIVSWLSASTGVRVFLTLLRSSVLPPQKQEAATSKDAAHGNEEEGAHRVATAREGGNGAAGSLPPKLVYSLQHNRIRHVAKRNQLGGQPGETAEDIGHRPIMFLCFCGQV